MMTATYKKKITGYTALARFLADVSLETKEVSASEIKGLPESRYSYSPTRMIESKQDYDFVRVETSHAVYSIFEVKR